MLPADSLAWSQLVVLIQEGMESLGHGAVLVAEHSLVFTSALR